MAFTALVQPLSTERCVHTERVSPRSKSLVLSLPLALPPALPPSPCLSYGLAPNVRQ